MADHQTAFFRTILDTLPDALIVINERGLIEFFSPMAEKTFGCSAEDAHGKNIKAFMPQPYRDGHDGYLDHYNRTGERKIIGTGRVVVGERKDGSTFPMELAIGEMLMPSGRYFVGLVRDLTARQMTETRLHELQAELVHISRLSTMGNMASALAHELNQPLSAITNYLKGSRRLLDQKGVDAEGLRDAIDKAADQALRAGDIIRRLRDFVSHGSADLRAEPLAKLIEEASALAMVGASGVRLRLDLAPDADFVLAARVEIQQVLVNLIRNGLEAMAESDRPELTIKTWRRTPEEVVVSVADTGAGIAPDVAANLFKPFLTTKSQGMGVGLSISRTIVEAHGGEIWADNAPGGGAVFSFTLPLLKAQER
jgi:two-component system sensor kinase FixL